MGKSFEMSDLGGVVNKTWSELADKFDVKIDEFQIMPNHVHGILQVDRRGLIYQAFGTGHDESRPYIPLGKIIRYFKAKSSYLCKRELWQRNYYERIIRNEKELWAIRNYIRNNPKNWMKDVENVGV